eukprot:TRINITY_DN11376_c0_g1::TRINITY_DN11376_c0_g1_i1::g.26363::m.26363 TRINITY_DN11376_c0_g1::TRINITY_DN11376_c0_g1_i1::g.26363  ORF type:complete len:370 (+),score=124.30,sp/O49923/ADK_PHYPA/51.32/2e-119,PfkB/PF00294.19/9.2e-63 TRINITY_DN11376_c0_g1_i1:64-1110(+)
MDVSEGIIFGLGNPLLDISAPVPTSMLEKYQLKSNDAILCQELHEPIYKELKDQYKPQFIAGGATQNAIRVAQWMLKKPKATSFIGCIGKDDDGELMKTAVTKDNVHVQYMESPEHHTGLCAVLITGNDRSMVANLGAANHYKLDHLQKPENFALVEKARVCYIAGFHLTVAPDAIMHVAKTCAKQGKVFAMNLSAPFIMEVPPFRAALLEAMPYVDLLFGNEAEAATFAKVMEWKDEKGEVLADVSAIAVRIAGLDKKANRSRVVVITQGSHDTVIVENGEAKMYPIKSIAKEKIVDTNGAGDAYVGGFLSRLALGRDIPACHEAGSYSAWVVIQQDGCTFPPEHTN